MKAWITSAFDDPFNEKQPEAKRLKSHKSDEIFKKPISKTIKESQNDSNQLLTEKYEPKLRTDLNVNKSKIDELSNCIESRLNTFKNGSILLLTGPPGCGKYVTLKVLCNEKQCHLVEWNSYVLKLENIDLKEDPFGEHQEYQESQMKLFEQFLFKSSRYTTDQIFNDENKQRIQRVLFIKEIPNSAYYDIKNFQNLLRKFVKFGKCLLVFSFNTSINTQWDTNPAKFFTNELKQELKIQEISFNAFANTYMIKALQRIISLEKFDNIDKDVLNELCTMSNGDLRFAINSLEFYFTKRSIKKPQKNGKLVKKSSKIDDNLLKTNVKDLNLSLFRGLGKILHRKNSEEPNSEALEAEKRIKDLKLQRKPLNSQPEDVYEKIPLSSDSLLLFLNQNYLEMFADRSQSELDRTFEALVSISEGFVLSDQLISRNGKTSDYSNTNVMSTSREFSSLITMRQILFSSYTEKDKNESSNKGTWKPLYKPYHYKVNEIIKTKKQDAINLFLHNTNLFESINCQQNEFFQIYLPYFSILYAKNQSLKKLLNFEQKQFLNSMLVQFNTNLKLKLNSGTSYATNGSMRLNQNDTFTQEDQENDDTQQQSQHNNLKLSQTQISKNNLYSYENLNNLNINEFQF